MEPGTFKQRKHLHQAGPKEEEQRKLEKEKAREQTKMQAIAFYSGA